jgi:hypothetical protein
MKSNWCWKKDQGERNKVERSARTRIPLIPGDSPPKKPHRKSMCRCWNDRDPKYDLRAWSPGGKNEQGSHPVEVRIAGIERGVHLTPRKEVGMRPTFNV